MAARIVMQTGQILKIDTAAHRRRILLIFIVQCTKRGQEQQYQPESRPKRSPHQTCQSIGGWNPCEPPVPLPHMVAEKLSKSIRLLSRKPDSLVVELGSLN